MGTANQSEPTRCPKCGHLNHKSRMHQDICTFYVSANGAECGCSHPQEQFDPETLHGLTFFDNSSKRKMRYIYPDAGHWCAGWIVSQNPSGGWMTWRKATDQDIASLSGKISDCGFYRA